MTLIDPDTLSFHEMARQEYGGNHCIFSSGFVTGHPIDTVYLRIEKDGQEPFIIVLRPDEMAAIAWVCNGTLWSHLHDELCEQDNSAELARFVLGLPLEIMGASKELRAEHERMKELAKELTE